MTMTMMRRFVIAAALFAGACQVHNDPQLKEHVATAHADETRLRAAAEAFVQKSHRCPAAGEFERVADPWGRPYVLVCPGQEGHTADVVSRGVDGDIGTTDDVRSWD
jgi:type II secretion system (T2SS) protein G